MSSIVNDIRADNANTVGLTPTLATILIEYNLGYLNISGFCGPNQDNDR